MLLLTKPLIVFLMFLTLYDIKTAVYASLSTTIITIIIMIAVDMD